MGGRDKRLSILTKLSNLSVRFTKARSRSTNRKKWLEIRKEVEAVCGSAGRDDEVLTRLAEEEVAAKRAGLAEIPPPSDFTFIRKRKFL
ncbi:MAG: hypothetical protein AB1324_02005 [Candidatus Micrarchaeota archaeon]